MSLSSPRAETRSENLWAITLFAALLAVHAWFLAVGWDNGNLPGHEFRQAQTALSALFVQRDQDFSFAYPTPVLGAPWSAPMEFPLYQWAAVKVSDWTGMPLIQAGRAVSAACFYLAVAGLFPLLGALGCRGPSRWVAASFALTCPLYIFYSRAFLIETMALAFGVWFLAMFVANLARPAWPRWLLVVLFGAGAAWVKITTFMVFLVPAGLVTLIAMWRARAAGRAEILRVAARAMGMIAVPIACGAWWTRYADAVKHANLNTRFLESTNLIGFNLGSLHDRLAGLTWYLHWRNLSHSIVAWWALLIVFGLAVTVCRGRWRPIAFCAACFVAPLLMFPVLYSWHDYYSVASALFLMTAIGLVVAAVFDARARWLAWTLVVGLHASQLWVYHDTYFGLQKEWSPGGSQLTRTLRAATNPDEVMVGAGFDWDSRMAFYSQRRALMIRYGMERDWGYLHDAFKSQQGQPITLFVRSGEAAQDPTLLQLMEQYFDIDPRPLWHWKEATVFGRKDRRAIMLDAVRRMSAIPEVRIDPSAAGETWTMMAREMRYEDLLEMDRLVLATLGGRPAKVFTEFGFSAMAHENRPVVFAHADTKFWYAVPAGRTEVRVEFCVMPGAYECEERDRSDGVEFAIHEELPDGSRTWLKSVVLDPARQPGDRGFHTLAVTLERTQPGVVVISSGPGPHQNKARDWGAFSEVSITRLGAAR